MTARTSSTKKTATSQENLSWVLLSPRLTEKSAIQQGNGIYTFDVHVDANKIQVKKAVQQYYNVTPVKVAMMVKQRTMLLDRSRRKGMTKKAKKALVYLKAGETIQLV